MLAPKLPLRHFFHQLREVLLREVTAHASYPTRDVCLNNFSARALNAAR